MALLQALVSGVMTGIIFVALSVGFSLTWGVTRAVNLAHTAFAVLAAYLAYDMVMVRKWSLWLVLVLILGIFFVLGWLLYQGLMRRVAQTTRDPELVSMVLTFGLAVALENAIAYTWTPDPRIFRLPLFQQSWDLLGIYVPGSYAMGTALALLVVVVTYIYLTYTRSGRAVRAVWQDPLGAALCGIDIHRVTALSWGIALCTAAAGGVAMASIYTFAPSSQFAWLIYVFLLVIMGGVGDVRGALVAGLLVGILIGFLGAVIPFLWTNFVLFVVLLAVLLLKPQGLLRR